MLIPVVSGVVSTAGHPNSAGRAHQMDPHTSRAVARAPSCPAPTSTGARRSGIATCSRHARRSPGFSRPILPRIHARDSWSSIFGSRSTTASLACNDCLVGCFARSFRCPCICVETRHQRIVRQIAFSAPRPPSSTPQPRLLLAHADEIVLHSGPRRRQRIEAAAARRFAVTSATAYWSLGERDPTLEQRLTACRQIRRR